MSWKEFQRFAAVSAQGTNPEKYTNDYKCTMELPVLAKDHDTKLVHAEARRRLSGHPESLTSFDLT